MEYKSEEDFLKSYDSNKYEKMSLTTDILVLSVSSEKSNNYRKLSEKMFSVLLVKRKNYPFKDMWCLPGGFVNIDEDIEDAPFRILKKETNLDNIYLEQLYTYGGVNRDPRMRVVSTSYIALTDKNKLNGKLNDNTSWFNIRILMKDDIIDVFLDNGVDEIKFKAKYVVTDNTTNRYKFIILENNYIAFDHANVILDGIFRLKNKIEYTDIVFNMMGEYFTLGELQQVYEVILGKKLLDPAFRRIIADKVVKTNKMRTGGGHRPSVLYAYKRK